MPSPRCDLFEKNAAGLLKSCAEVDLVTPFLIAKGAAAIADPPNGAYSKIWWCQEQKLLGDRSRLSRYGI